MDNIKKATLVLIVLLSFGCLLYMTCFTAIRVTYPRAYSEYVEKYSREFSVPEHLVYSVIKVESNFDKTAQSSKGACGLMQLMPKTYAWLAEASGETAGDIFDPQENIKYGTYYLSVLYKKYNNWTYALCAYNAGTGNVDKWLQGESFSIPFAETKKYVNKLEVAMDRYKNLYY